VIVDRYFLAAGAVAFTGSAVLIRTCFGAWFPGAWALAGILTLTHGFFSVWINVRAVGGSTTRFFIWALGLNGLRFALMLGVLAWAHGSGMEDFQPFLAAVLFGYFALMAGEVWSLHVRSLRGEFA
jgi:hypothetical protein